jgi:hypothetical protein
MPLTTALCKTFLVEQAKTQLRVVVPIEEEEEFEAQHSFRACNVTNAETCDVVTESTFHNFSCLQRDYTHHH